MSLTRRRWFILALAAFVNLFAGSIYAWSVFAAPLAEHLSRTTGLTLTAGNLAIAFSLANAVGPIPLLVGGWVTDRFGPRPVMVAGGLLVGLGYWMTGAAESLTAVLVGYGLFFGIGTGVGLRLHREQHREVFPRSPRTRGRRDDGSLRLKFRRYCARGRLRHQ